MLAGESGNKSPVPEASAESFSVPAAITDTGCERELNEDRYAVVECPSGLAWMVCDGMGGVAGGELAAQIAIDSIRRDLESLPARPVEVALRSAILEANRIIVLRRQNQAFAGMGTTVVAAMFDGPEVVIGHAGDSRAYLIRDRAIQQLTTDHTYVQELVENKQIKPEEAMSHPQAHVLTRCIGSEPGLQVSTKKFWVWQDPELGKSDALLLVSDGLYSMVSDGEIANLVSEYPPQQACVKLVDLAKSRGGYDNITMAIIPLGGQLRSEPPIGYTEPKRRKAKTRLSGAEQAQRAEHSRSFLQIFMIVVMLSILSALLTVLGVAFSISK